MKKLSEVEMRAAEAGAKYTATEKCPFCGKKFTATATYAWWNPFSYLSARSGALALAHKKATEHLGKCNGW